MQYLNFLLTNKFSVTIFWLAGFLAVFYILKWLFLKKGKSVISFLFSFIISVGEGVKDNPKIQSFFGRHPLFARFLKKRSDHTKFSGLMLTVLALVALYAIVVFVGTAIDVFVIGNVLSVDLSLANLFHTFRNPLLVKIFLWVTLFGKWQIVAVIMMAVAAMFWVSNKKNYIIPFFVSIGGSFTTGVIAKYIWQRPRPIDVAVYVERSWSFPSGHAILAIALYGFLTYFSWKYFKQWKTKIDALFLGLLIIILIGFSRLYLGVHYLSDVWAGSMVGLFWVAIAVGLVESKNTILPESNMETKSKHVKIIIGGILCLLIIIYVGYGLRYKPLFSHGGEEPVITQIDDARVGEIFTDHHLPKFTETILGNPQEPFSFIVTADSDEHFIKLFEQAGWFLADSIKLKALVKTFKFAILNKPYPTAPMTPYFWQTYVHDYGFQEPTDLNSARYRHHARFWRTEFVTASGQNIYVGITSLDIGIKWWGLTHTIKPDIDSEREYLFKALNSASAVGSYSMKQLVDPVLGKNFTGDQFFTDGKVYVINLK